MGVYDGGPPDASRVHLPSLTVSFHVDAFPMVVRTAGLGGCALLIVGLFSIRSHGFDFNAARTSPEGLHQWFTTGTECAGCVAVKGRL